MLPRGSQVNDLRARGGLNRKIASPGKNRNTENHCYSENIECIAPFQSGDFDQMQYTVCRTSSSMCVVVVSVIPLKNVNIPFNVLYVACDVSPFVCGQRLLGSQIKLCFAVSSANFI